MDGLQSQLHKLFTVNVNMEKSGKIRATVVGSLICTFSVLPSAYAEQPSGKAEYVGVENCRVCHMPHYESWLQTKMSNSYELLKPNVRAEAKQKAGLDPSVDYTADPVCLKCHVTGCMEPDLLRSRRLRIWQGCSVRCAMVLAVFTWR